MRIFNAVNAVGNGHVFGNGIAAYLGIDAGIFHMAMEYGSKGEYLKYLDVLSREKSIGTAAVVCTQAVALGLTELKPTLATNYNYIHACKIIRPRAETTNRDRGKVTSYRLGVEHWNVCTESQSVRSRISQSTEKADTQVEISLWAHPDASGTSEKWAAGNSSAGAMQPSTHQLMVTITPAIQLYNERCSLGIELAGSVQLMHCAELDLQDAGCTRLILNESYKVKEFQSIFSKGTCFGLLVIQSNEIKWAQFVPKMHGFDECYKEMNNEDYLPPFKAA